MKKITSLLCVVSGLLAFTACDRTAKNKIIGGGSATVSSGGSGAITTTESTAVVEQFFNGVMGSSSYFAPRPAPTAAQGAQPVTVTVSQSINETVTGPAGGRMAITGRVTGTANDSGLVNVSISMTETITDYKFIDSGVIYVINGDPYLSVAGTITGTAAGLSSTSRITLSGGFKVTRGSVTQSCAVNVTIYPVSQQVTGTVCGESVNQGF